MESPQRYLTAGPIVVLMKADRMLNRPRSSFPRRRRMIKSRFSARSSGGMPPPPGRERLWHLPTRSEDNTEPSTDDRHQRSLCDEEIDRSRKVLRLLLVACVCLNLLGLDDEVGGALRLDRHLAGGEDAHPDLPTPTLREDDVLVDPVLRNGKIDVPQVDCDLHRLGEFPGRSRLEGLEDGLDRL